MNNNHIIFEYDKYLKEYKKKYGGNTILLMQVGSFFEMCAIIEQGNEIGETNIHTICDDVLNVVVGKKWYKYVDGVTGISEQKEYYMGGFPLVAQEKYFTFLLNHNYTVVLVEQVTEPPNPEREVTKILSPGTDITYNKKQSNFLVSIYIEKYSYNNKEIFEAALSAIDLSTGKNFIHDIKSDNDNNYCIDEISRLINFYNPSELIFQTENFNLTNDDVINKWDISHDCYRINHYDDNIYKKPSYQNNLLNELFNFDNMLSNLENLNLDNNNSLRLSYIYLLSYINEHKMNILTNIETPVECEETNYLNLTANSIRQLNIVNNYSYFKGKNESLLSICNICLTSMGKRMFKDRLLYPLLDTEKINSRYEKVETFQIDKYYNNIRSYLVHIQDLEKTVRLMSLDLINPYQLVSTYLSYEYVNKVIENIKTNNIYRFYNNYENDINIFNNFRHELKDIFNFENITNDPVHLIQRSLFNIGYNTEIDKIDEKILEYTENIKLICDKMSSYVDSYGSNSVKIWSGKDNDEWILYSTKKRVETFKKKMNNLLDKDILIKTNGSSGKTLFKIDPNEITYKPSTASNVFIIIPLMKGLSKEKYDLFKNLSKLNKELYEKSMKSLYEEYNKTLKNINEFVSDIDVASCSAKIAIDNKYSRPKIIKSSKSYITIKDIRHPIVERINLETEYITNNIELGKEKDGILLFGTNACGKSTFMKAVGLNLIMAQAGLFVACSEFTYSPYTQIFTRILNNDNIFRSESTFAVEMNELRSIMKRADDKSLVLGDELCSGTETTSALSIVYAGLYTLCKKKSTFVFTSHLHQITKLDLLKELNNLQVYHLQIKYIDDVLIYDRKLKEGPGPSIYGITVCEALGLSNEFVSLAKSIQKKLENNGSNTKTSHYNCDVIMDKCRICSNPAEETHHIKEQCFADENNMIDHHHKNNKHNLVPLCKKCHDDTTYGKLIIEKYINTSDGIKLIYNYTDKKKEKKKKFNVETIEKILTYKNTYNNNKNQCIQFLELNENIKIGKETLKKIMENKY